MVYVNFLPLDMIVMLLAFMLELVYTVDLLLISSTCSELRRMTKICEDEMFQPSYT